MKAPVQYSLESWDLKRPGFRNPKSKKRSRGILYNVLKLRQKFETYMGPDLVAVT